MHGWDLDITEKNDTISAYLKKYAEMEVQSSLKGLRKRENLISVSLEMHVIFFSIWETMSTIPKLINFYEEFTQSFLASNYEVVQSKRKLTFAKAVL